MGRAEPATHPLQHPAAVAGRGLAGRHREVRGLLRCCQRDWRRRRARSGGWVKALGQHVHQETPDELVRVKLHCLPAGWTVDAIVFPAERDAGVVSRNEAAVRDGDTMRVTGEIPQYLLGSGERRLAVDHPLDVPQWGEEALERPLVGKAGMGVE